MGRILAVIAALMLAVSPAAAKSLRAEGVEKASIPAGAKVIIMTPDVELSELGIGGASAPKADWSKDGAANLRASLEKFMKAKTLEVRSLDKADAMEGHEGQLMRLHDAVGQSILEVQTNAYRLPEKKKAFDWTLGEGTAELATKYDADYALFTTARGTFSGGGRMLLSVLTLSPTGAGQQIFLSLVELKTGRVVWFNYQIAGPDMRQPASAEGLITAVMRDAPL